MAVRLSYHTARPRFSSAEPGIWNYDPGGAREQLCSGETHISQHLTSLSDHSWKAVGKLWPNRRGYAASGACTDRNESDRFRYEHSRGGGCSQNPTLRGRQRIGRAGVGLRLQYGPIADENES